MPEQSDRPENPDEPEWARSKWIVGMLLVGLGQYLMRLDIEYQLAWLFLGPVGIGLILSGFSDYIHLTRLQAGRMRQFKIVAIALAACGLLLGLYAIFRPRPDYFAHLPQEGSPLADPVLGFGATLIIMGLVVWQFARDGRTKSTLALRRWVIVGLCIGAIVYGVAFPHFLSKVKRSMQNEARTNLGGIWATEMEFYKEHGRFGNLVEIGFVRSEYWPFIRYTYRIDASGKPGTILATKKGTPTPDNTIVPAGISPDGQSFTATATAHLDTDETIDQWHVNDIKLNLQYPDSDDVWK